MTDKESVELRDLAAALYERDVAMGLEYDGPVSFYEGEARWAAKLGITAEFVRRDTHA